MSEPGIGEQQPELKHYVPDYKLTRQELDMEGGRLVAAFEALFKDDPDVKKAKLDQLSDESLHYRAIMFKKGQVVYRTKSEELKDSLGLVIGQRFNLMRYDEEMSEEDLTIVIGRGSAIKPFIKHNLVFSKIKPLNRDYVSSNGLAVTGAGEMLERTRRDFAKPVSA
ncbi:MAG: hypothetical protein COU25_03465 [Candidatus Levybacteria bacterium CG10_big_fil_rev_8_21_14_0_10_35_13]|nr:MAG: hypothetical protein COU25_03465 [Candidatus Levybacteria bacterium CG10_big_fil_rev_8_21_14_0_10_35_13]